MNRTAQKIYVFLSILTLCLLIVSVLPKNTQPTPTPACIYVLRDYNGKIALFSTETAQPLYVFAKDTEQLPAEDQAAIRTGIYIENEDALRQVMEDFFE